jgi:hypothetical protein
MSDDVRGMCERHGRGIVRDMYGGYMSTDLSIVEADECSHQHADAHHHTCLRDSDPLHLAQPQLDNEDEGQQCEQCV